MKITFNKATLGDLCLIPTILIRIEKLKTKVYITISLYVFKREYYLEIETINR
jgi:hypothetical protein